MRTKKQRIPKIKIPRDLFTIISWAHPFDERFSIQLSDYMANKLIKSKPLYRHNPLSFHLETEKSSLVRLIDEERANLTLLAGVKFGILPGGGYTMRLTHVIPEEEKDIMLTLSIKKKWFDMILSGEKKEEYRDITPYYNKRFMNALMRANPAKPVPIKVRFRNGYRKDSPSFDAIVKVYRNREGNLKWGAEPGKKYFVLKIVGIVVKEDIEKQIISLRKKNL